MGIAYKKRSDLTQSSKLKGGFLFYFQLSAFLTGCPTLNEYSRGKRVLSAISTSDLKGTNKVDVIKRFG
ncbi:MAG: hypothetical protein ISS43_03255 [Candidatus Omnitrophica bacterium]|nr:hypothetical protein [Candidatus Omnitrophota bacterium]